VKIKATFRFLEHANGLLHFHTKAPDLLKQEVYANPILHNLGIFLANEAIEENWKKNRKQNKYAYEVDVSSTLKLAWKFLLCKDSFQPGQVYILFF
jgi:hypothetical protein